MSKLGLFTNEYEENSNELLKKLSSSPFIFYNNNKYIDDVFEDYKIKMIYKFTY